MYSSNSGRNFLIAFFTGHAAPSDSPQIVVPGMIPIESRNFQQQIEIFQLPRPERMRSRIFVIQLVPSRHGVHCPHDSCDMNRQQLYSTSTMLV